MDHGPMAHPCYFLFGVHNHQPVGNFDWVIEEATLKAYKPFIELLERHPQVRLSIHFSGPLLDYLIPRHPETIERLKALGARGQVEFMTGAYYEPILPIIPDHDKVGQIEKMSDTVERYLGQRPTGMWLAERVWEPHLPEAMVQAGVRYCVIDETHFRCAGLTEDDCFGYHLTDEVGASLALFPILEKFRYTIPFADPKETLEVMRQRAENATGPQLAVMADDGEKFGVWPKSHEHCYENGWLEGFFTQLEAHAKEFPMIHFSEALERLEPLGRIFLPSASYFEMMEWAMPSAAIERYEEAKKLLEKHELTDQLGVFFRGGFWRNFLYKYPESNQIHKKMLHISRRIQQALTENPQDQALHSAREFLWQGQCNCAYWHGVFGGIYLNHLRHALHRSLNIANRLLGEALHGEATWAEFDQLDYDADGNEEILIETDRWVLLCAPRFGAALVEVNYKPRDLNLPNTLARRPEAYHDQVAKAEVTPEPGDRTEKGANSIHGSPQAKEKGLDRLLQYDSYRRLFAIDHFFPERATFADYRAGKIQEIGDFIDQPYQSHPSFRGHSVGLGLRRVGRIETPQGERQMSLTKILTVRPGEDQFLLHYTLKNLSEMPIDVVWGVEFNINLLAGDAHDRYPFSDGQEVADRRLAGVEESEGVERFGLIDEWMDLEVALEVSTPTRLWRNAIETVSLSENGFERVYQGTCLLPNWRLTIEPGKTFEARITVTCSPLGIRP